MRGKQAHRGIYSEKHRNIPAYAGKTRRRQSVASSSKEHPRVCGENSSDLDIQGIPPGTSPRMRGKRQRLTTIRLAKPEHPRVCGENGGLPRPVGDQSGTSPRMRGKPGWDGHRNSSRRNIPAYAGKTCSPPPTAFWKTEHPRVCGENVDLRAVKKVAAGTSPRMRGKQPFGGFPRLCHRNIPAYAGKTY